MGKSKVDRSLNKVGESQIITEETHSKKFEEARPKKEPIQSTTKEKRNFPQVCYTISPEDKKIVEDLTVFATVKKGKIAQTSVVVRALIRYGNKHREELEFE